MATPLSEATLERLRRLFPGASRAEATRLLADECGDNLPFCHDTTPEASERVRFAALKVSAGDLRRLRDAVQLAQVDWRDLLVQADFAGDPLRHLDWWPPRRSDEP